MQALPKKWQKYKWKEGDFKNHSKLYLELYSKYPLSSALSDIIHFMQYIVNKKSLKECHPFEKLEHSE